MKKNMIRVAVAALLVCAAGTARAVPTDGGEWTIGAGETETLAAEATVLRLAVDGTLTLDAGAALTATGAVVNCISTGDGMVASMTIVSGASFTSQGTLTGDTAGNTQGFSIGTYGGTGMVTVASSASLTVTGGRLFLGRNKLTGTEDRTKLSHGILNIFGTVTAAAVECSAWFPSRASGTTYDLDTLPVASIINLEEGGVLETGLIQNNDTCRNIINFKGGTLRIPRSPNPLLYTSVSTVWNIESGKSLIFDTQSFNATLNPSLHQADSFKLTGAGGLVKRGSGLLDIRLAHPEMNTFTGPIVVEGGSLRLGRPLAEGQTVLVKSGATFYPVCFDDLTKITYEDPADMPNGAVFHVEGTYTNGLDLITLSPVYCSDKLGGPSGSWNGEVHGAVTHAAGIDLANPFGLVGLGNTLNLYNTGLESLPLAISGTGTFNFNGDRTNTTDNAITFTGAATYKQTGAFSVMGEDGAMPVTTISGGGTFTTTGELRAGYDQRDGAIVVSNGVNVSVGNIKIGCNASTRYGVKGRMVINNATVTTSGTVYMGSNGLVDGSDLETLKNEFVLGSGATLNISGRFQHNDDPRSRITFAGGVAVPKSNQTDFFYSGQNGILEVEASNGNDIKLNIGGYSIGATTGHTHFIGTGGLDITGTGSASTFTLGKAGLTDFSLAYSGATKITDATLVLGVPLHAATTVTGTRATLFLNDVTTTNNVSSSVAIKGSGSFVVGADGQDFTFSNKLEGVTLVKVGAGTLTIDKPLDVNLVVKGGTVVVRGAAYKSYRFKVEAMKGPNPDCMQFSELVFYRGSENVTRPYAGIGFSTEKDSTAISGTFSATETPSNVVDGAVSTKWCDQRGSTKAAATDRERLWVRIDYAAPKLITGYAWYTANDRSERDPSAWRLQGSNDGGATWTDIDVRSGFTATSSRKALAFNCTLPGPSGVLGPNSRVVVEPGATLRLSGGAVPASAIVNNGGTVELADGATLTSDGGVLDGGVSGTGSLGIYGGNVTLAGEQTYTGDTHVFGGTLNVGAVANPLPRAFGGKYFRLTIKRSNGGNSGSSSTGYVATGNTIQASEFQLYSAGGDNLCSGLAEVTAGTPAYSLAAGKFACDRVHATGSGETYAKLFDGNTGTKLYTSEAVDGTPASWHVVVMRLADNAAPVTAYNFYTANDYVRRSPTSWSLEGSYDGATWEVLDERWWAPHTTFTDKTKFGDSSIQKKPFNNGVNYQFETVAQPTFGGKFLRFKFKKTAGTSGNSATLKNLQISQLLVIDALGNNAAKDLAEAANNTAATALAPGSFTCPGNYYNSNRSEGPKFIFDESPDTKICSGTLDGAEANYKVFTMRLPEDAAPVKGYVFVTANDSLGRSPSEWLVEGSYDGETWTTLDERTGVAQPYCLYTAMNAGHPFTFTSLAAAQGRAALPDGSVVTVDAGATLNLNDGAATISKLRVDCTAGAGTINSFRPAAGGTLELVNFPAEVTRFSGYEVPITVTDVQDAANLRSWTVTVNGVRRAAKVTYRDGKIMLLSGGTYVIVR